MSENILEIFNRGINFEAMYVKVDGLTPLGAMSSVRAAMAKLACRVHTRHGK